MESYSMIFGIDGKYWVNDAFDFKKLSENLEIPEKREKRKQQYKEDREKHKKLMALWKSLKGQEKVCDESPVEDTFIQ